MARYGVLTPKRELYTYRGAILVHDNREELEWLLVTGQSIVRLSDGDLGQPTMNWSDHPQMTGVFPLQRKDFR